MIQGYSVFRGEEYTVINDTESLRLLVHDEFISRLKEVLTPIEHSLGFDTVVSVFGVRFQFNNIGSIHINKILKELERAGIPYDASLHGGTYGAKPITCHLRFTADGDKEFTKRVKAPGHKVPSMINQEYYSKLFLTRQLITP